MSEDKLNSSLYDFVEKHNTKLSLLYGVEPGTLSNDDLRTILTYTFGLEFKKLFKEKGRLDDEALAEIKLAPKSKRNIDVATKAIVHKDIGNTINKPIHKARDRDRRFGSYFSERIEAYRTEKMRQSFKRLVAATAQIEARTRTLVAYINYAIQYPSPESRRNVSFAIRQLNGSLVAAHMSARAGTVWALRSGFGSRSVSKALSSLYIQRMNRIAGTYKKLDTFLAHTGIRSNISDGIVKRKKILTRELMMANADPDLSRGVSMAAARRMDHDYEEPRYGR